MNTFPWREQMKRRDDEREEEPPLKKAPVKPASTQSAIFTDDALGYAFAVPPSFQVPAKPEPCTTSRVVSLSSSPGYGPRG